MYRHKYKYVFNTCYVIMFALLVMYFLSSFYFNFKTDEEISMGLAQKNIYHLISIDSLDVHPPFYYIALRIFLILFTFWTKSFFIKVIFARVFSAIFLILSVHFLMNILKLTKIIIDKKYFYLLYLLSPGIINESTKIRMYSLAAFLLIFELYELLLFVKKHKIINIIIVTIITLIAFYTIYPLAVSAGIFLFIFFLIELRHHQKKSSFLIFLSGILVIIAYLPWITILFNQIKVHSFNDGNLINNYLYAISDAITQINAPSPTSPLLKYTSFVSIFIILILIVLIIYSLKNNPKRFNNLLIIVLINFIFTLFLMVMICKRQFRVTVVYPIYSILICLVILIILKYIKSVNGIHLLKIFILFYMTVFVGYASLASINNIKNYDIPSIRFVKIYNNWRLNEKKNININKEASIIKVHNNIIGNATNATQDAMYLNSINKNAVIKGHNKLADKEFIANLSNDKKNYKLFDKLFTNLKYKS